MREKEIQKDSASRRRFLKCSSVGGLLAIATGCRSLQSADTAGKGPAIPLGQGDIGVMNYAYLLEGMEAEFYTMVMMNPYANMSAEERQVLTDIRDHEIVHREFFKRQLGGRAIPDPRYTFARVDFNSRHSVLSTALMFEDLGVAAYNGAGKYINDPGNLAVAGKIVSVEARHASVIRDLIAPGTEAFAEDALDGSRSPADVLAKADPYILTKVTGADWKEARNV